jgi:heme exporter protein D
LEKWKLFSKEAGMMFDQLNAAIRNSEASLVNLLSALAPWAAPIAPAYMSFTHMTETLEYPIPIAWAVVVVVEVLGLSAISTIIAFWSYNRRYKAEYRKAPVWIAISSFVAYLAIVLVVNVLLDASQIADSGLSHAWVTLAAKALLTLLSVPAAVILAVRTQHKELLDEIDRERERERRRDASRSNQKPKQTSNQMGAQPVARRKQKYFQEYQEGKLQETLAQQGLEMTPVVIARMYQVSERTAYRWMAEIKSKQ